MNKAKLLVVALGFSLISGLTSTQIYAQDYQGDNHEDYTSVEKMESNKPEISDFYVSLPSGNYQPGTNLTVRMKVEDESALKSVYVVAGVPEGYMGSTGPMEMEKVEGEENIYEFKTVVGSYPFGIFGYGATDEHENSTFVGFDDTQKLIYMPGKEGDLSFGDISQSDWFYDSVKYVNDNGLMTGLNETTFGPYENLARAQFAVILHRISGSPETEYTDKFPDVADGQWYTDAILWASEAGVVGGYSDTGKFGPSDNINREQMAVMMYRYAEYLGYDTSTRADISQYADAKNVNEFAREAMSWAVGSGIITGKENGTKLDPQGNASRAECATIIMRFNS